MDAFWTRSSFAMRGQWLDKHSRETILAGWSISRVEREILVANGGFYGCLVREAAIHCLCVSSMIFTWLEVNLSASALNFLCHDRWEYIALDYS